MSRPAESLHQRRVMDNLADGTVKPRADRHGQGQGRNGYRSEWAVGEYHDRRSWSPRDGRSGRFSGSSPLRPTSRLVETPTSTMERRRDTVRPRDPAIRSSFDAKVAAGLSSRGDTNLEHSYAISRDDAQKVLGKMGTGNSLRNSGVSTFESDVKRAMMELEKQLAEEGSLGIAKGAASRCSPRGSERRQRLTTDSASSMNLASHTAPHASKTEESGILSQMELRRVAQGGGKGKPGGLKDMWNGVEPSAPTEVRRRQKSDSLVDMRNVDKGAPDDCITMGRPGSATGGSYSQRQGPGLKGMWSSDDAASGPTKSQRQGPGLRALWTGPDTAAVDAVRNDAKAAYLRALDHDVRQRHALLSDEAEQMPQGQAQLRNSSSPSKSIASNFSGDDDPGSAGIGAIPGTVADASLTRRTPRRREPWEENDRLRDKAKKAAYAEELRRQIAENIERKAKEKEQITGLNRRSSIEQQEQSRRSGSEYALTHQEHPRANAPRVGTPLDLASNNMYSLHNDVKDLPPPSPSVVRPSAEECTVETSSRQRTPGGRHLTSPHMDQDIAETERPRSSAARRRLVEDVYGGRVGAALAGSGYRWISSGNGDDDLQDGTVSGVGQAGSVHSADEGTSSNHLRTGVGVQSLHPSEPEDRWRKRAAALEQQRALEQQIAAKAKVKREEEERLKLEEEEEARRQQDLLRKMEADAEEEKRRKQAEQHEQLEALYQQQEEALRKKRAGATRTSNAQRAQNGSMAYDDSFQNRSPAQDHDPDHVEVLTSSCTPRGGGLHVDESTSSDGADYRAARRRNTRTTADIDDLPAGAQARAVLLRASTNGALGTSPSWSRPASTRQPQVISPTQEGKQGSSYPVLSDVHGGQGTSAEIRMARVPNMDSETDLRSRHTNGRVGSEQTMRDGNECRPHGGSRGQVPLEGPPHGQHMSMGRSAVDEPPLRSYSRFIPLTSKELFPDDGLSPRSSLPGRSPSRGGTISAAGVPKAAYVSGGSTEGDERGLRGLTHTTGEYGSRAPGGEVDTSATSWQTEHLRRQSIHGSTTNARESPDGACSLQPFVGSRRRTTPWLPRGDGLRDPHGSTNDGFFRGREVPHPLPGNSVLSTPRRAHFSLRTGRSTDIVRESRRLDARGSNLEGGTDASEQSLTSDSVLFYLTSIQHEDDTRRRAPILSDMKSVKKTTSAPSLNQQRHSQQRRVRSAIDLVPPSQTQVTKQEPGQGSDEEEPVSPLTKLLAATDAQLERRDRWSSYDMGSGAAPGSLPGWRKGDRRPDDNGGRIKMAQELNIGLMSSFSPVIGTGPEPKSSRPATGKNVELSAPESHGNTERVMHASQKQPAAMHDTGRALADNTVQHLPPGDGESGSPGFVEALPVDDGCSGVFSDASGTTRNEYDTGIRNR